MFIRVGCVIGQKHICTKHVGYSWCYHKWLFNYLSCIFPRFQEKLYGRLAEFLVQLYMNFFSNNYDNNELYHCLAHDIVTWDEDRNVSTVTVKSFDLIVWRRLAVGGRNVAISIPSNYFVRQTIIMTSRENENLIISLHKDFLYFHDEPATITFYEAWIM